MASHPEGKSSAPVRIHHIPMSAELACERWHFEKVLEGFYQRALAEAMKATLGGVENWQPSGLRLDEPVSVVSKVWLDRARAQAAELPGSTPPQRTRH